LNNQRFAGKKILVTGSSRGIGAGIARKLASEGASVAVTYSSNPGSAEQVMSSLKGDGHLLIKLNISDEASVTAAFEEISTKWGKVDGVVNNAGVTRDQLLLRMKTEDFQSVVDTNLKGTFLCTRAAAKMMASKAGVEGFSKSVAQEIGSRSIRVNCVAPGFIVTDMTDAMTEQAKTAILSKVPLNTLGDVDDVANAVAFLLSDESKYITGHTLSVNGGMYM
jgi:3-oxoacyl-[acyl-carrier protein] reductase